MSFELPVYCAPDFSDFAGSPDAVFKEAPADGVAPEGYHATSIYPEYFRFGGKWLLAEESRMDCTAVLREGRIYITEFRHIKKGDMVAIGRSEDGSEGIYVHTNGFEKEEKPGAAFAFRQGRSRETSYSKEYDFLYDLLRHEKEHGNILWVMGPACAFDSDSREAMADIIEGGYAHGIMAGNALATHDLEAACLKTALGQDIYTLELMENGHYNHIDIINRVRACGGIRPFVKEKGIDDGIMAACCRKNIPFVLCGSIRDDGPLPDVIPDVYKGQDEMRKLILKATTIICMATVLHTIATGNMTPTYRVAKGGKVRPLYFYSVDVSEFAVNKLTDRGSLGVRTLVTNAQDFVVNIKRGLGL